MRSTFSQNVSILDPVYNVTNTLSVTLLELLVSCCCGNPVVNHLLYVDDTVLSAPSAKGLQRIIDVIYII